MTGEIQIEAFVKYLEKNDLVLAPRTLVQDRLQDLEILKLKNAAKRKKALTLREIYEAQIWGNDITYAAVKKYAMKHTRTGEIFPTKKGKLTVHTVVIGAVERIARQRGQLWD